MVESSRRTKGAFLAPEALSSWVPIPSAQTLFRSHLLGPQVEELITRATAKLSPEAWERDREDAGRIEQAATVEALLDLLPIASGTAEPSWHRRMREFGPEVVPLIVERLKQARDIEDDHLHFLTYEHLLSALRWKGEAGAAALLDCFDDLGDYGKSLACISLGLVLGGADGLSDARGAAETMCVFYESVKDAREDHFVGGLWGLIDLKDLRAADAVANLLWDGRYFYELFGFLSLVGDARAVLPLLLLSALGRSSNNEIGQHAAMALLSIGHRIGRDGLLAEFQKAGPQTTGQQREREGLADDILTASPRKAEEYFALFYRGLVPEDIDLAEMAAWKKRFDEQDQLGWPARQGPTSATTSLSARHSLGRNDPCWCGSGKKYKHCHMRQDEGWAR